MLVLQESQDLQILFESLEEHIPESLKVYGVIFNIRNKNPFSMEVLVDAWPDYQTVITRPKKEEMKDDLDHYTNTYQIFTKDPDKLEEILRCPQVINWEQVFQIQSFQESVGEAITKIAASESMKVDYTKTMLFFQKFLMKQKTSNGDESNPMDLFKMSKWDNENNFPIISLDSSHAELVNKQWGFGKNETSLKFVRRCLQNFPGFGVEGPERTPISWMVMDQSCELRMGYTFPKYRGQGNMWQIASKFQKFLHQRRLPFYLHVSLNDEKNQDILRRIGLQVGHCGWHQWICRPHKYC
ncbi:PREDICTED: glycine N-acyltransferase-like protein 2-like [Elephantulus edwardii]|uniref:glycine N-acyltransferase-like protein 2-like n=1 Tax=Elephantulus edwardii TaxID=28737 RepID=UPI0003F0AE3C|nr:PREDICTED: glycine N-acyltransferase-like protein 2-like [Elephantulus edwardii]